jgi:glycosyltransferase involved in cell wall biosynthesis
MPTSGLRLTASIIVPTYNRAGLLEQAIESALQQTRIPDEVIVVDDGSTDNTQEVLRRFGSPVVAIYQSNARLSAARNHGMRVARGDVFLYLDSDGLLLPNCVERTLQFLEEHPDVDVVYSDCYFVDKDGNRLGLFSQIEPGDRPEGMVLGEIGYRWFVINPSSTAVRRSALRDIEFDDDLSCTAEDFEFWRRLAVRSRFHFIDEALACYRIHDAQISTTRVLELVDGAIEVQRRIMEMPEFDRISRGDRARLYCLHGVKHSERGRCGVARKFFFRSVYTSPGYLSGHVLLFLTLLGLRPLQAALRLRRRLMRRRPATKVAEQATVERRVPPPDIPIVPTSFTPLAGMAT